MKKITFFKFLAFSFTAIIGFTSCDKDYNQLGSDLIGDGHFNYDLYDQATVTAYNQPIGIVQTNNQTINSLGVLKNDPFGTTISNFVTQAQLAYPNPIFDNSLRVSVDSVALIIPYFSKSSVDSVDGSTQYTLDSIYGKGTIDLRIYENGYKLNDFSPSDNFTTSQKYYSDQFDEIENYKKGSSPDNLPIFNGTPLNHLEDRIPNTTYKFRSSPISYVKRNNILEIDGSSSDYDSVVSPRMRINLNTKYFENRIFNAPSGALANHSSFKDYFRGIYFQINDYDQNGAMAQLDFSKGYIAVYYNDYESLDDNGNPKTFDHDNDPSTPEVPKKIFRRLYIKLKGNSINLHKTTSVNAQYQEALSNRDIDNGDSRLYIKGGVGSIALIDLFKNDELQELKDNKWMINEANLTFYIDQERLNNAKEPTRVYLYDATNKNVIQDYTLDATSNSNNTKLNKYIYDGIIQKDKNSSRGLKYRIRLTNHIRNLVRNDSANVRLALAITESIGSIDNAKLKTNEVGPFPPSENPFTLDRIPRSSVMSPLGTILYGSNIRANDVNHNKRLKLEIYYTKPN